MNSSIPRFKRKQTRYFWSSVGRTFSIVESRFPLLKPTGGGYFQNKWPVTILEHSRNRTNNRHRTGNYQLWSGMYSNPKFLIQTTCIKWYFFCKKGAVPFGKIGISIVELTDYKSRSKIRTCINTIPQNTILQKNDIILK